jgi:His/Glu/Gln/Arg/opine family amino acid ABC transporter permease subunit
VSWDDLREWIPQLLWAAGGTLKMAVLAYAVTVLVGLLITLARRSRRRCTAAIAAWYVELVRGTPALTQLFLIYFGLASAGVVLSAFIAAVIGLGLNYAAYMSEVYRAGIDAVHRGQREAALAIGMTNVQAMRSVIMPQALRIIVPPMANYAVSLLKDTSVASLISAPELTLRARDLSSEYFMPMELYLLVGAMYLLMAYPLGKGAQYLEARMGKGRVAS